MSKETFPPAPSPAPLEDLEQIDPTKAGMAYYYAEICQYRLLTNKEVTELAQNIKIGLIAQSQLDSGNHPQEEEETLESQIAGGISAQQYLIVANARLVLSIAWKYVNMGVTMPIEDLVQNGNIGLIRAVKKFDSERGVEFPNYACIWIRGSMSRALRANGNGDGMRRPNYLIDPINRVRRTWDKLEESLGRQPKPEDIAKEFGLSLKRAEAVYRVITSPSQGGASSLDKPLKENEGESQALGERASPTSFDPFQKIDLQDLMDSCLSEREIAILQLRYNLTGDGEWPLEEIGNKFGLTRERIRVIIKRALQKLRDA